MIQLGQLEYGPGWRRIIAVCPAKVNLTLAVVGELPSGDHRLVSLMQALDLADELVLTASGPGDPGQDPVQTLQVSGRPVTGAGDNLVLRASEAFLARARKAACGPRWWPTRLHWQLHKRIPVGAGLAGGSSDAAGALAALQALSGTSPGLGGLANDLGADIPFCLNGNTALATGSGRQLHELTPLPGLQLLLISWPFELGAAEIYADFDRQNADQGRYRNEQSARKQAVAAYDALLTRAEASSRDDVGDLQKLLVNDLEPAITKARPELGDCLAWLRQQRVRAAWPTGSGPTLVVLPAAGQEPHHLAGRLKRRWPVCEILLVTTGRSGP